MKSHLVKLVLVASLAATSALADPPGDCDHLPPNLQRAVQLIDSNKAGLVQQIATHQSQIASLQQQIVNLDEARAQLLVVPVDYEGLWRRAIWLANQLDDNLIGNLIRPGRESQFYENLREFRDTMNILDDYDRINRTDAFLDVAYWGVTTVFYDRRLVPQRLLLDITDDTPNGRRGRRWSDRPAYGDRADRWRRGEGRRPWRSGGPGSPIPGPGYNPPGSGGPGRPH